LQEKCCKKELAVCLDKLDTMSKRERPLGIVIALLITFGLSAGGIWWAYQFGFGTRLSSVQFSTVDSSKSSEGAVETNSASEVAAPVVTQSPTPTLAATLKAKTADTEKFPIREQVKFIINSREITSESQQALDKLVKVASKDTNQDINIKIDISVGKTEFSDNLAIERGETLAGYFRDKGLSQKIIISKNNDAEYSKQTRNKPVKISLVKR
jgi:outer membrane protein OmpA-like peptidoglycan-associated protein